MNAIAGAMEPQAAAPVVGLVNNMSAAAFVATDAQFVSLLQATSAERPLQLRRFAPPGAMSLGAGSLGYEAIAALWPSRLDGLIVTGAEPKSVSITDEPSWKLMARLVDWAADHTHSAIWSCLAAHAAVFRLDGVARRRAAAKISGVFACRGTGAHRLLDGAPPAWPVPHSRFNDLDAEALARAGYRILAQAAVGVDMFGKQAGRSAFLMLQGHPEYAADTLYREYRRDLRRWAEGAAAPMPPEGYFDAPTQARLGAAADAATCLAAIEVARPPAAHWRPHGVRLFRAWLARLRENTVAGLSLR